MYRRAINSMRYADRISIDEAFPLFEVLKINDIGEV